MRGPGGGENVDQELDQAIAALLNAQSILESIHRDMVDPGGSLVGLPSPFDLVMDCMTMIDDVLETLGDLEL